MMQLLSLQEMSSCFLLTALCWNAQRALNYSVWVAVNMIWCQPMSLGSTIQSVQRNHKYFHFVIMKPDNKNNIYHSLSTAKWHPWARAVIWEKWDILPQSARGVLDLFFFLFRNDVMSSKYFWMDAVKQMWSTSRTKHLYVKESIYM